MNTRDKIEWAIWWTLAILIIWGCFWFYGQWEAQKRMIERGQEVSLAGAPASNRYVV